VNCIPDDPCDTAIGGGPLPCEELEVKGGGETPEFEVADLASEPRAVGGGGELPYTGLPIAWVITFAAGLMLTGASFYVRLRWREKSSRK
jgi:LPXTG-motif cell wall-anchored protein